LALLAARVAFNSVRSHGHWTGVHRIILKVGSYFAVRKNAPPIGLTQPFETMHAV
jgi:hypothetical protein